MFRLPFSLPSLSLLRHFREDRRGNVAVITAFALMPLIGFTGVAVDYSRANSARTALQAALDSTALMLSKEAQKLNATQLNQKATDYFNALFTRSEVKGLSIQPTFQEIAPGSYKIVLTGQGKVDTTFWGLMRIVGLGQDDMQIGASAEVVWGIKKLELALALDNTTSMASQSRMTELKKAAKNLLVTLQKAAQQPDDIKIAIIPYGTDVNIGTGNVNQSWLDWGDGNNANGEGRWKDPPRSVQTWLDSSSSNRQTWERAGPGSACPFTTSNHGFQCSNGLASTSNNGTTSTIPDSGQNAGLICPSRDNGGKSVTATGRLNDRYYNGCWNSREKAEANWYTVATGRNASCGSTVNCSCSGSGSSQVCKQKTYDHYWRPSENLTLSATERNSAVNQRATPQPSARWNGCVRDRDESYDVADTAPGTIAGTKFQPVQAGNCEGGAGLEPIVSLNSNWTSLSSTIDNMNTGNSGGTPTRYTNVTIGLAWAWHALTSKQPLTEAAAPRPDLDKVIILMTDGDNTRSRVSTSASAIDSRTALACTNAKADGIRIYTVRLMEGNESLLKDCATRPDMYYNVDTASQLNDVFTSIAQNLANLRISK
ncbi:MAG TPA: Tad domain-containing protein [Xanthobacteraceae bacterium]|nr:Tad domain-containing protein [Xanthobacteraceae bacterium]